MGLDPAVANKIANAKTSNSGNPIKAGNYVLVIKQLLCDKKFNGTFVIPEFDVVESEVLIDGVTPNKPESDCSCAWQTDKAGKAGEAALGNIKQFGCALLGLPENTEPTEIMQKIAEWVGGPTDPDRLRARGMLILCSTRRKKIQNGPNAGKEGDFPHFSYVSPEEGNSAEEIAERRAKLDAEKR